MSTQNENFFQKIEDEAVVIVDALFGKKAEGVIVSIEANISKFGNAVVNEFKALEANPTIDLAAEWFVKIAEGIDPGLTPLISGIELEFPKIINFVTGVLGEVAKPVNAQLSDGLNALQTVKAINGTVYAGALGTINAAVQEYVISNNATTVQPATASQLLTSAVIVHAQTA